jgi:hypothetical protein
MSKFRSCKKQKNYSSVSVNSIPEDALMQAAQFAVKEHSERKCIPHVQIGRVIKERMGWK